MPKAVRNTTKTKRCAMCRAKFTPKAGGQKYCSSKCSDKAKRIKNRQSQQRLKERRKLAREQEQQQAAQPKPRWDLSTVELETFPLPDNGIGKFCHRQPDPYWGF